MYCLLSLKGKQYHLVAELTIDISEQDQGDKQGGGYKEANPKWSCLSKELAYSSKTLI